MIPLLTALSILCIAVYAFGLYIVFASDRLLKRHPTSTPARRAWLVFYSMFINAMLLCGLFLLVYCIVFDWQSLNSTGQAWRLGLLIAAIAGIFLDKRLPQRA